MCGCDDSLGCCCSEGVPDYMVECGSPRGEERVWKGEMVVVRELKG